jgi:SAM-dependent methyltransferase
MMTLTENQIAAITAHNIARWNRLAPTYASGFEALTGEAAVVLLDLAGVGRDTELLDIGTGPGSLLGPALARGASVTAVDLAPEMIAAARSRYPTVEIHEADAHHLPFADASFDAVTMGFMLHHVADPPAVLRAAYRVLRPGGRLAFTVWDDDERAEAINVALAAFGDALEAVAEEPPQAVLGETPADFERLLRDAGFAAPTARVLEIGWEVADGGAMFDGLARYLDLGGLAPEQAAAIRARIDESVRQRAGTTGTARLANPAIVASGRRP